MTDSLLVENKNNVLIITMNRPESRNALSSEMFDSLLENLILASKNDNLKALILTGAGSAFCSGGDQRIRGKDGYKYAEGETAESINPAKVGRLHILEVQRLIRFMPKVVIAVVPGWAAGGGHSLHVVCDLTIASKEFAMFKQTDPDVASFDAGFGSAYLARQMGQKRT